MNTPIPPGKPANLYTILLIITANLILVACSEAIRTNEPPAAGEGELFRPPSPVSQTPMVIQLPSPSPESQLLGGSFLPTPTLVCENGLKFLEDLSYPDSARVDPGAPIDKRWRVQNTGTCNWDDRYRLRVVSDTEVGVQDEQALYPARGGIQAVIRVQFTAPMEPGSYHIAWQAIDPQGRPFGDAIYIEFIVTSS